MIPLELLLKLLFPANISEMKSYSLIAVLFSMLCALLACQKKANVLVPEMVFRLEEKDGDNKYHIVSQISYPDRYKAVTHESGVNLKNQWVSIRGKEIEISMTIKEEGEDWRVTASSNVSMRLIIKRKHEHEVIVDLPKKDNLWVIDELISKIQ